MFIFLCFANVSNAQTLESKIDDLIQPLLSNYPGIQIAISKDDKILLTKSYGYSDLAKQTPLENNDRFRIYSVAKLITTVALLQLVEEGLLDPEKPIDNYITTWDESKINPYKTKITPMHLALHRSGIRHYSDLKEVYSCQQCYNMDEAIDIFKDSYLLFEPGTQRSYSSWGFVLLSKLVEAVAQKPFSSYVDEMIFKTVNMDNTYLYDRQQVQPLTRAYEWNGEKYIDVSFVNPSCKFGAGGFVSTAKDLTKFSVTFFDGKLISSEMIKLAIEGMFQTTFLLQVELVPVVGLFWELM